MPILDHEFRSIDTLLRKRQDADMFRVTWSSELIEVFQRRAFDVADMLATFGLGAGGPPQSGSVPLLRFTLASEQPRLFQVERWNGDAWQLVTETATFAALASYLPAPE